MAWHGKRAWKGRGEKGSMIQLHPDTSVHPGHLDRPPPFLPRSSPSFILCPSAPAIALGGSPSTVAVPNPVPPALVALRIIKSTPQAQTLRSTE